MTKLYEPHEYYKNLSLENIEDEVWADIEGYEGRYQISDMGRVKSLERLFDTNSGRIQGKRKRILKSQLSKKGYVIAFLFKERERKSIPVHRLVGFHFIENPENKPQINHKKGSKTDNRKTELEWATNEENKDHAVKNGLVAKTIGEKQWCAKLNNEDVVKIRELAKTNISYEKIGAMFGVSTSIACSAALGKTWKHIDGGLRNEGITKIRPDNLSGEKHGNSKLTENDILEIRRLATTGMSGQAISEIFNISKSNACLIIKRKAWRAI